MYLRWQARKRQQPAFGYSHGNVSDEEGWKPVRNRRGSLLRTRLRADGSVGQDVHWNAVLVESVRVGGKPQQRHIASIAGISESGVYRVSQRRYFWDKVHERLDRLGNRLSIEDRRRIEAAIALKVPRLTREEHEASVEGYRALCTDFGRAPPEEQPPWRPPT
jgi:hypothetical protein